jgi:hypothetical protein
MVSGGGTGGKVGSDFSGVHPLVATATSPMKAKSRSDLRVTDEEAIGWRVVIIICRSSLRGIR